MGEVYRATDTNLKRAVAIKVLPESVATDGERMARFQREAELLASLNHPNIAAIYGLERSNGATALVMELVEGPTLADRIAQGAIPVDEALHWDVHMMSRDGQRFVFLKTANIQGQPAMTTSKLVVVLNWFEELQRLVPRN